MATYGSEEWAKQMYGSKYYKPKSPRVTQPNQAYLDGLRAQQAAYNAAMKEREKALADYQARVAAQQRSAQANQDRQKNWLDQLTKNQQGVNVGGRYASGQQQPYSIPSIFQRLKDMFSNVQVGSGNYTGNMFKNYSQQYAANPITAPNAQSAQSIYEKSQQSYFDRLNKIVDDWYGPYTTEVGPYNMNHPVLGSMGTIADDPLVMKYNPTIDKTTDDFAYPPPELPPPPDYPNLPSLPEMPYFPSFNFGGGGGGYAYNPRSDISKWYNTMVQWNIGNKK